MRRKEKWLKIWGSFVLLIPIAAFVFLAAKNGTSGSSHYLQAAPVVGLLALSWWRPLIAGWGLLACGTFFACFYAYTIMPGADLVGTIVVTCAVFLPLMLSGYLFLEIARIPARR